MPSTEEIAKKPSQLLLNQFRIQVQGPMQNQKSFELDSHSLAFGWAMGNGMSPQEAQDFATFINFTHTAPNPVEVHDVVLYILKVAGDMPPMKLHLLAYYCQAWALGWDDGALIKNRIEAGTNGPIFPKLYEVHRGKFKITPEMLDPHAKGSLSESQKETIDTVLATYKDKSPQWLSDQSRSESPWQTAQVELSHEITLESMAEYYGAIPGMEFPYVTQ